MSITVPHELAVTIATRKASGRRAAKDRWTQLEDEFLMQMYRAGWSNTGMSLALFRTSSAVRNRLWRLKIQGK